MIKQAVEKANITPDMDMSEICDAMKTVMPEVTLDGLTGAGISFDENGEPNKAPKAVVIENGAYKSLE